MQIIAKSKQFTDEEIDQELINAVKESFNNEIKTEEARVVMARAQSQAIKGHKTIPGLGKCVAVIPPREYFRLVARYGQEEVHSKEFLRDFNKRFADLSPNKA
jgi:hypothetical protein